MDQRERIDDPQEVFRAALDDFAANFWVALPGVIESFDSATMTAKVKCTLKFKVRDKDGNIPWVEMPLLVKCPVVFMQGGEFIITFPIESGDECLVIFADRCIDSWWDLSGVQVQAELRLHDLSDGFVIVGPRSRPRVTMLGGMSASNLQIRTVGGSAYIELTPDGHVNIVAPQGLHVTGTIDATGEITSGGTHTLTQHRHSGVQSGGSLTNTPTG